MRTQQLTKSFLALTRVEIRFIVEKVETTILCVLESSKTATESLLCLASKAAKENGSQYIRGTVIGLIATPWALLSPLSPSLQHVPA